MPDRKIAGLNAGRAVVAFGILVLVILWIGVAWELGEERARTLAGARSDTANLSHVLEEHVRRTMAGLDQTLIYLKDEYERDPARFDVNAVVRHSIILKEVAVQLAVVGADGELIQSSAVKGPLTKVNVADREHFRVHARSRDVGLFISRPVLGRTSGRWSIQLTRRLETRDGGFAGVMVLSLDPDYFNAIYSGLNIGKSGVVVLAGADGVVRAASDGSVGRPFDDPVLISSLFSNPARTMVVGPTDDERRIVSFRALGDFPLGVVVGRSETEVLASVAGVERTYVLVGVVVTLVLGLALVMLYSLVRHQETIARDLTVKKAELLSSRERLRRYVADLERIAEVAAHDLQEPLRRVVAYAQLLASRAQASLDAEGRDYIAQVVSGAHLMSKLVRDLEAFVAVDHLPPAQLTIPASGAVTVASERLSGDMRRVGGTLLVDALPSVAADERSLSEIFTQLVDNALRYRDPDRRPLIHVSGREENGWAVFSVRDNGTGIEGSYLPRIFEVFHRLPSAIDGQSGTGMGLAIVRRMVERLGGRVWVQSVPGEGSTFFFSLPLLPGQQMTAEKEAQAA